MSDSTDLKLLVTDNVRIEMEDKSGRPLSPKKLSAAQTDSCKARNSMLQVTEPLLTSVLLLFSLKTKVPKYLRLWKWMWRRQCSCLGYVGNASSDRYETDEDKAMEMGSLEFKT